MNIEIGKKYNRLTAVKFSHKDSKFRKWYLFSCECGGSTTLHTGNVTSGNTKSCGCLRIKTAEEKRRIAQETKQGAKTAIYLQYKRHAKERGYNFNLSKDELLKISQHNCYYCGTPPSNLKKTKNDRIGYKYNGIDRIDNNLGYSVANCVAACKICNYAKGTLGINEFNKWAKRIGAMATQWA